MAPQKHRDDQLFVAAVKFAGPVQFVVAPTGLPGHSDPVLLGDGSVADPTYAFTSDPDTGQFLAGPDVLGFGAGGVEATRFTELNGSIVAAPEANVGLTADIGSAQGDGVITSSYNVYSTVATAGDAATLPAVFAINSLIYIKNDGAESMDVFPAVGDNAGAGLNTAVAIPSGQSKTFIATSANATWTEMLISGGVSFPLLADAGSAGAPAYSFAVDPDTGMFRTGANTLRFALGGVARFEFKGDVFQSENVSGPAVVNVAISANTPQFCPNQSDLNTGLGSPGQDEISLIAGSVEAVRYFDPSATGKIIASYQLDTTLTALPGGGQPGATLLRSSHNEFTTVATAGDSALLMSGHPLGTKVFVKNNGTNSMDIFPNSGDNIDALGVNVGISLPAGKAILFMTTTGNDTWTVMDFVGDPLLLGDGSAGAPTYSFSGDPDTGIFTGFANVLDVTLGGVRSWTFQAASFGSQTSNSSQMLAEAATSTNPTLIPHLGDATSGIGADAASGDVHLIGQSVSILRARGNAAAATRQVVIGPAGIIGSAVTPSLAFGDGDTGFYEGTDDNLFVAFAGIEKWKWTTLEFKGSGATGVPSMINEVSSAINPVWSFQADADTGIGRAAEDQLSLIAGGLEGIRVTEAAAAISVTMAGPLVVTGKVGANQAAGPALLNEDASSTNPTLVPNQADDDTGIGRDTVDGLAFIAGGVSCMRVREIAAAPAVGLYTTTPIVQQTGVAVTSAGIHAALVNLGAFTA